MSCRLSNLSRFGQMNDFEGEISQIKYMTTDRMMLFKNQKQNLTD